MSSLGLALVVPVSVLAGVLLGVPAVGPALAELPLPSAAGADRTGDEQPLPRDCVATSTEVRPLGFGYQHIVRLVNDCDRAMRCTVKTDANPEPSTVTVESKSEQRVVTHLGSPARIFKAEVECEPAG